MQPHAIIMTSSFLPRPAASLSPRRQSLPRFLALVLLFTSSSHAFLLSRPTSAIRDAPHASTSSSWPSWPSRRWSRPSSTMATRSRAADASLPPSCNAKTALNYASRAAAADPGPMSQVDSGKSGGCPFLDTSYVYKTYSVPALFSEADARPIILFDGECNLCNKFVQTLLKYDNSGNLRFAALQSRIGDLLLRRMSDELRAQVLEIPPDRSGVGDDAGEDTDTERYKSIVICGPEKTYIRSSAVFQILQSLGGSSKRLRALQYLALIAYVLPTRARDGMYEFVSRRRKRWFGASDECLLWDDRFEDRFVDDGVLTGTFRDPFADPRAMAAPTSTNLFEGESPPVRGDRVRIVWPVNSGKDPSVSYDDEFPDGICLIGGTGTISTVDLPMRVVCRVDRGSIGLGPDADGGDTMIAWVKPEEVAALP